MKSFFNELKRRNVLKAALAYIVVSWIALQVASILFPAFALNQIWVRNLFIFLLCVFPIWVLISWYYEITPEGIKKTKSIHPDHSIRSKTSNKLNYIIIGALAIAIVLFSVSIYTNINASSNQNKVMAEEKRTNKKSVAVLAFSNMSSEKNQEYFSDGISEEILNYLAKNPELTVISRTSSFSFKNKNVDIQTIGEKLNVNYILEGSVRKADSTVRITAKLIQVDDGANLWSETYDRKIEDIFAIQDEIAQKVTRNLETNLLGIHIPAVDTEAYTKYLQAKEVYHRFTQEAIANAAQLIDESLKIDSTYAPSWLLKAKTTASKFMFLNINKEPERDAALTNAMPYIAKAIELDSEYAQAYSFKGEVYLMLQNFSAAKKNFEKAFDLQPNNAEVLRRLSAYPTISLQEREKIFQRATELDPLDEVNYIGLALTYFDQKKYSEALNAFETYLTYSPYVANQAGFHAEIFALAGCKDKAYETLKKETNEDVRNYATMALAVIFNDTTAENKIKKFSEIYPNQYYLVSQMYAFNADKEKAYQWLEKAVKDNSWQMISQIQGDPYMDNLRNDKRFRQLMQEIEFPEPLELNINKIQLKK